MASKKRRVLAKCAPPPDSDERSESAPVRRSFSSTLSFGGGALWAVWITPPEAMYYEQRSSGVIQVLWSSRLDLSTGRHCPQPGGGDWRRAVVLRGAASKRPPATLGQEGVVAPCPQPASACVGNDGHVCRFPSSFPALPDDCPRQRPGRPGQECLATLPGLPAHTAQSGVHGGLPHEIAIVSSPRPWCASWPRIAVPTLVALGAAASCQRASLSVRWLGAIR